MLLWLCLAAEAQQWMNLTASQVRIDSLLPVFTWQKALGPHYADSTYTVTIEYPEFIDMQEADIQRYRQLTDREPGEWPEVSQHVGVSRKQGVLDVAFVPIVKREGKYQKMVSFRLKVEARESGNPGYSRKSRSLSQTMANDSRYADHSVLREGSWAKIRIPQSGIYQLTDALIRKAGFSDLSKVRVYGYGGALQPESLTGDYLTATDDLQEVPTCTIGGKRFFYATGPVTWSSKDAVTRIRNNYSDDGYYFLTDNGEEPLVLTEEAFKAACYPAFEDYHSLYEEDGYAWFSGGRNLYESTPLSIGKPQTYQLTAAGTDGVLGVSLTYDSHFQATVSVNDSVVGSISAQVTLDSYTKAAEQLWTYPLNGTLKDSNTITITQTSGGNVRLDYLSLAFSEPTAFPDLTTADVPVPEYVSRVANQDLHGDEATDMVIVIPASQKWLEEAERIKSLHESRDGLRVRLLPADALYNEFSSGTPDANAYRRYLKMLYDRAETEADIPRYLLLFGDGAWDNRLRLSDWKGYSPDDFLLCYESDNSFSATNCYVSDDYFCLLDDGEQIQEWKDGSLSYLGKPDVAVGRLPARTVEEAKILVDKILSYTANEQAGAWQNTLCFMGDDGNNNLHMATADKVATMVQDNFPGYDIQKIYWDAYPRQTSSTGNTYPDVTSLIKNRMTEGALVMNYSGHGISYALSHEYVLRLADFAEQTSLRLPLWVTASCDIMPFDGQEENIGETAMLNKHGGAIAFFGTTRTVYANYNEAMNLAFTRYVLDTGDNGRISIGEAARRAKCDLVSQKQDMTPNKLQYTLLGDPALVLAAPTQEMVIDEINGESLINTTISTLSAGSIATIKGHVVAASQTDNSFRGIVTAMVRDAEETIVCRLDDTSKDGADTPFSYQDRTKTLYHGSDSIRDGVFTITFAVPKDISYTDGTGLLTLYAVDETKTREAHGEDGRFMLNGSSIVAGDSIGPGIYCYLNTPSFVNGGQVHTTPYFVAELYDDSGINASGSSIGHDLELVIDGQTAMTYNLNSYFSYDFGDYRSGRVSFSIPELTEGHHQLRFRAWDVLNNSSTAVLDFEVVRNLTPGSVSVDCTRNPATTSTTFIVTHDRAGSELDVWLDIYDMAGRQLWRHHETGVSTGNTYTFDWDLCVDGGRRLQTGVYLYRVTVGSDGGEATSKARKLIILSNK